MAITLATVREEAQRIVALEPDRRNIDCVYADEQGNPHCIVGQLTYNLVGTLDDESEWADTDDGPVYMTVARFDEQVDMGRQLWANLGFTTQAIDWLYSVQQRADHFAGQDDNGRWYYPTWTEAIAEGDENYEEGRY